MSGLRELIDELCPDGVEYIELGKLADIGTGRSDRKDAVDDGAYPFYVRSQDVLRKNDYEYDEEAILVPGEGSIGQVFHYVNGRYALHQRVYRIHVTTPKVLTMFVKRYMESEFLWFITREAVTATVKSIRKPMIQKFRIPVPPIEVQREIVHILDSFQELDDALTAEIEARTEQFHYLQDKLYIGTGTGTLPLGSCVRFINGRAYKKAELLSEGKYRVLRVGNFFSNDSWYYSNFELDSEKYCLEGDLLYAWSTSFGPRIWHGEKSIFHYHIWKLVFDEGVIDKDYLLYFLDFDSRRIKESSSVTQSTMMHVSMA